MVAEIEVAALLRVVFLPAFGAIVDARDEVVALDDLGDFDHALDRALEWHPVRDRFRALPVDRLSFDLGNGSGNKSAHGLVVVPALRGGGYVRERSRGWRTKVDVLDRSSALENRYD